MKGGGRQKSDFEKTGHFSQECNARKVNCSCVYSAYILKPVLFGGISKQK